MSNNKRSTLNTVKNQDLKIQQSQKSLSFLPDIPFQRTVCQDIVMRDKHNASSMNQRMTTTTLDKDSIRNTNHPFTRSIQIVHNPSSNSSSPSTNNHFRSTYFNQDSTMNKGCKNIRNYHHLYELHMTQKLKVFKERERLGQKKIWLLDRLPPLETGAQMNGIGNFSKSDQTKSLKSSVTQQQFMKRIQRDQEGQLGINLLTRESNGCDSGSLTAEDLISIQNSTGNIQQDTDILLGKTRPLLKKNTNHQGNNVILTFKSVEIFFIENDNDRQKIHSPIYLPVLLLKELLNLSKSQLEIKIMQNITYDSNTNTFTYLKKEERPKILKQSSSKNSIIKKQLSQKNLNPQIAVQKEITDSFPEVIYSSIFVHSKNKDFKVIIKMPTIEYSILSKNFIFIKTLSRSELREYLDLVLLKWDETLIKHLMQYRKFLELLKSLTQQRQKSMRSFGASYGSLNSIMMNRQKNLMQTASSKLLNEKIKNNERSETPSSNQEVYVLDEKEEFQIVKYQSLQEYQKERIFKHQASLKGCFERQGIIGKIQLKSFSLSIKGLSSEYSYREQIKYEEWKRIIAFMKYSINKNPANPAQFVDMIADTFQNMLEKGQQERFRFSELDKLQKYEEKFNNKEKKRSKTSKCPSRIKIPTNYLYYQKKSKIILIKNAKNPSQQDRYLLELEYPSAKVYFEEQTYVKNLQEDDCEFLIDQKFQDWKKYLMNQHFRLELNISSNEPLPRIKEVKREDDDLFSEEDFREKYPPKDEEEKQKILVTRDKLSQWFPY